MAILRDSLGAAITDSLGSNLEDDAPATAHEIQNGTGTSIIRMGSGVDQVSKAGVAGWDSYAHSVTPIDGSSLTKIITGVGDFQVGLLVTPAAGFLNNHYGLETSGGGIYITEHGIGGGYTFLGAYSPGDVFWIYYNEVAAEVKFYKGAVFSSAVQQSTTRTSVAVQDYHLNISMYSATSSVQVLYSEYVAATSYTLTSTGAAVYTITGNSANLNVQRRLTASAAASYTLTGQSASLRAQRRIAASTAATYALTGQQAVLRTQRRLTVTAAASYSLTGQNAALNLLRRLSASAAASYTLTGQSVSLRAQRLLSGQLAAYSITGQNVQLVKAVRLDGLTAAYTITGQPANLRAQRLLAALSANYSISGQSASLNYLRRLAGLTASYTITGHNAILAYSGVGSGGPTAGVRVTAFFYRA
jgi:hypothetical protein